MTCRCKERNFRNTNMVIHYQGQLWPPFQYINIRIMRYNNIYKKNKINPQTLITIQKAIHMQDQGIGINPLFKVV